jgi:hypothetical protein
MKGKGQGHSWPSVIAFSDPAFECSRSLELFPALDDHFLFFVQIELQIFVREPRVANFFTRSPNYALFFFRARCVYSYMQHLHRIHGQAHRWNVLNLSTLL